MLSYVQIMSNHPVTQEWVDIKSAKLPEFTMENMSVYFVSRLVSDGKAANDYKNLKKKAYPLFKAGHIQSILVSYQNDQYIVKCICLPEMKKDILYKVELTIDSTDDITGADCGCPADAKPNGSCKHISALCYAIEKFGKVRKLREPESCTSRLQEWNQPRKRRLESEPTETISFVKEVYGKQKCRPSQSVVYDPQPIEFQGTSTAHIIHLRQRFSEMGKDIAFLHVLPLSDMVLSGSGKRMSSLCNI